MANGPPVPFSRRDILALGLGLTVLAALHGRVLVGAEGYYDDDYLRYYLPWYHYGAQQLRAGNYAPWCDRIACGYPMWADGQASSFYPPCLLRVAPLPISVLAGWLLFLHYVLALAGMYTFARLRGASPAGSLTGALTFVLTGFMVAHLIHPSIVFSSAYLPWAWYAVSLWNRHPGPKPLTIIALCSACALLVSYPQIWLYTCVSSLLILVYDRLVAQRGLPFIPSAVRCLRSTVMPLVAIAVGMAIAAVQLVPLNQLGALSQRAKQSYEFATSLSLELSFLPDILLWRSPLPLSSCQWEWVGFMGVGSVLLVIAGTWAAKDRRSLWVFWVIVGFALFFAFSRYNPLYHVIWRIPLVGVFRGACRWLLVAGAAISALVALCITGLQTSALQPGASRRLGAALGVGSLGLLGLGVVAWRGIEPPSALVTALNNAVLALKPKGYFATLPALQRHDVVHNIITDWLARSAPHALSAGLSVAALSFCLFSVAKRMTHASWAIHILVVAIVLEGFLFARAFNPTAPRAVLERPSAIANILQSGGGAIHWHPPTPGVEPDLGLARFRRPPASPAGLVADKQRLCPNLNILDGIRITGGYLSLELRHYRALQALLERHYQYPLVAAALGAEWLLTLAPPSVVPQGWRPIRQTQEVSVYRNPAYRGLAWVVASQAPESKLPEALRRAREGDPRLLETAFCSQPLPDIPAERTAGSPGRAWTTRSDARGMAADCETARTSLVLFASTWYPGVTATVDGHNAPVHRCNIAFCGVKVPPGKHHVELTYHPTGVRTGAIISGFGLLGLLGLTVISRRLEGPNTRPAAVSQADVSGPVST